VSPRHANLRRDDDRTGLPVVGLVAVASGALAVLLALVVTGMQGPKSVHVKLYVLFFPLYLMATACAAGGHAEPPAVPAPRASGGAFDPSRRMRLKVGELVAARTSPDMKHVAIVRESADGFELAIGEIATGPTGSVQTGELRSLHRGREFEGAPQWSPDSSLFAYRQRVDNDAGDGALLTLVIVTCAGEELARSEKIPLNYGYRVSVPTWSPSGREVAIVAIDGRRDEALFFSLDGRASRRIDLPKGRGLDYPLVRWAPRGDRIAIEREEGVRVVDVARGTVALLRLPGDWDDIQGCQVPICVEPQWSADGTKLLFAFGGAIHVADWTANGDVVVRRLETPQEVLAVAWDPVGAGFTYLRRRAMSKEEAVLRRLRLSPVGSWNYYVGHSPDTTPGRPDDEVLDGALNDSGGELLSRSILPWDQLEATLGVFSRSLH